MALALALAFDFFAGTSKRLTSAKLTTSSSFSASFCDAVRSMKPGGAANVTPHVTVAAAPGDVVLYDLRLRNRDGANPSASERAALYLSYCKDWFTGSADAAPQTRSWDALLPPAQQLFARLDAREYTRQLEAALVALGGDPRALQSAAEKSQANLEL